MSVEAKASRFGEDHTAPTGYNLDHLRGVFQSRTIRKLVAYGDGLGLDQSSVLLHLVSQYPAKSLRELAAETGTTRKTVCDLLDFYGVSRLTNEETIQRNIEQGKGIFGFSEEEKRAHNVAAGRRAKELGTGIHAQTTEERKKLGRQAGNKTVALGLGVHAFTHEQHQAAGKRGGAIGGKVTKDKKLGIHALTTEERRSIGREIAVQGLGIHGLDLETRKQNGAIGGSVSRDRGVGIHALSDEERSEVGKKGGNIGGRKAKERGTGLFGMSDEQIKQARVRGGNRAVELRAGFHGLTAEQRKANAQKGARKTVEFNIGIHGLTPERRKEISVAAGRRSFVLGRGLFGIDSQSGERYAVISGRRSQELGVGIHRLKHADHVKNGLRASEVMSTLKVLFGDNYFDSYVEAATAIALETFIPDFTLERGANYQVVIEGTSKKIDFMINGVLVEYNPIILTYPHGRVAGTFTQEEYETYRQHLNLLDKSQRAEFTEQVRQGLLQRYIQRRREAIDQAEDARDRELIVVTNPRELYEQVITRFGQNFPTQEEFSRFFNLTTRIVKNENRRRRETVIMSSA